MVRRITELVNSVVTSEGAAPLSEDQILDLIDTGASEGGSQVRSQTRSTCETVRALYILHCHDTLLLAYSSVIVSAPACLNLAALMFSDQQSPASEQSPAHWSL